MDQMQVVNAHQWGRLGVPDAWLCLGHSTLPEAGAGVFATQALPAGTLLTPAGRGEVVHHDGAPAHQYSIEAAGGWRFNG